jgi:F0F1-type ATP synthase assembly protein I
MSPWVLIAIVLVGVTLGACALAVVRRRRPRTR